ncbi:MAG: hypothetical protein HOM96_04535 [Rickettsiales bacterium]|jgi:hypothetical protein|nr:hypothetical protein [Rickettsiales bacterium]
MKHYKTLKTTSLIFILSLINASHLFAMADSANNSDKINFSYNINYNVNAENDFNNHDERYSIIDTDENFSKDKFGKLISFNDEKIQNEKILDFVGMFTSRYDSRKKLRFKIRLDNDYKLQKALISYKFLY